MGFSLRYDDLVLRIVPKTDLQTYEGSTVSFVG